MKRVSLEDVGFSEEQKDAMRADPGEDLVEEARLDATRFSHLADAETDPLRSGMLKKMGLRARRYYETGGADASLPSDHGIRRSLPD